MKNLTLKTLMLSLLCWSTTIVTAQMTAIPDINFEKHLKSEGLDNVLDGAVLTANIDTLTHLDFTYKWPVIPNINDLTGIQDFTALAVLNCGYEYIDTLDVTQNSALTELVVSGNLTSLDVTQNTALKKLSVSGNLTSLDVTQNTLLELLRCSGNQLTSLDLGQNTFLMELSCSYNNLTSLDITQNVNLVALACAFNQIDTLNFVQHNFLDRVSCENNQLTSLRFVQCAVLASIGCFNNKLTDLDLTQCTALIGVNCRNNFLDNLDVRNGSNASFLLFDASLNDNLSCIYVDDKNANYLTSTTWVKDSTTFFANDSLDCVTLGVEDVNTTTSVSIYPNPSTGTFIINTTELKTNGVTTFVYDINGKLMVQQVLFNNMATLNLEAYPKGIYTLQLKNRHQITTHKLIKQ